MLTCTCVGWHPQEPSTAHTRAPPRSLRGASGRCHSRDTACHQHSKPPHLCPHLSSALPRTPACPALDRAWPRRHPGGPRAAVCGPASTEHCGLVSTTGGVQGRCRGSSGHRRQAVRAGPGALVASGQTPGQPKPFVTAQGSQSTSQGRGQQDTGRPRRPAPGTGSPPKMPWDVRLAGLGTRVHKCR